MRKNHKPSTLIRKRLVFRSILLRRGFKFFLKKSVVCRKINNLPGPFREIISVLFLMLIVLILYGFLFRINPTAFGDALRYHGYQTYIIRYSLLHYGQFALWDQFLSSGMSWISHPGGPLFYPITWLVITLFENPVLGTKALMLFHAFTAALSMYLLLRILNLNRFISILVAIPYIANEYGYIVTINGWFEELYGFTLIPLSVALLLLALKEKKYIFSVLAGIVMSLHFLASTYFVFHYNLIILIWLIAVTILFNAKEARKNIYKLKQQVKTIILLVLTMAVVLLGMSAVKLFPLLEFRNLSVREKVPLSVIEHPSNVLPFSYLFDRIRGYIHPTAVDSNTIEGLFMRLGNLFAFMLIILAFIYGISKRSKKYILFSSLLIIGLWGFLANRIPIDFYALMYYLLPGFNSNQFPFRFLIVINFAYFMCLALGLNLITYINKNKLLRLGGYFFGIIIAVSALLFSIYKFDSFDFPDYKDPRLELEKNNKLVVIKNDDLRQLPVIQNINTNNYLVILSKILKTYKPEGRLYSTVLSEGAITSIDVLRGELTTVHHSYEAIIPTYQFGILKSGTINDEILLTKKRYKIFSVLNTRFQYQENKFSEFKGCPKLELIDKNDSNLTPQLKNEVCTFLENRIAPIFKASDKGIYYDRNVLSKFTLLNGAILLISDNRFNDYSGFIAKQILFHPDFDEQRVSVFSGPSPNFNDYLLEELQHFQAIIIVNPKISDQIKAKELLEKYQKSGGKVLILTGKFNQYDNLQMRSSSIYTNKPAWIYTSEEEKKVSSLLTLLKLSGDKLGYVKVQKFTPEESIFSVKTTKDKTVFQFSDSFYPGWKATIDNKETPLYMADGLVKGIIIPKSGIHTVRFFYDPSSFKIGAAITLITIGILLSTLIFRSQISKSKLLRKVL